MNIRKCIAAAMLAACVAMPAAHAEVRTYEGTGEHITGDFETQDIARQVARAKAERDCVGQAKAYVMACAAMADDEARPSPAAS